MKTVLRKILAERMKHFRKMKGWVQNDLAKSCDRTVSAIAQIETGKFWPSDETLLAISDALEIPAYKLLEDFSHSKRRELEMLSETIASLTPAQREAVKALIKGFELGRKRN